MDFDVIVVGSGAAGLTAAVVAALNRLRVLVLESTSVFGGTTAYSAGGAWIPNNHHMKAMGVDDSRNEALVYLKAVLGEYYDATKIEAFVDEAPEMLAFLEAKAGVLFSGAPIPDYAPGLPGWKTSRCLLPVSLHASHLGAIARRLRPPIPEIGLFHSMQISSFDAYQLQHWRDSKANLQFAIKRVGSYFLERLCGKRGQHLANGNALVARLLKAASDLGVTLRENSRATGLLYTGRRVTGVTVEQNGRTESITAKRGVVLASGGFGANEEMRRKFIPMADAGWSLQPEGCMGDGIKMGVEVGGTLNEGNAANGIWVPASATKRADGSLAKFPSLAFDRHCPGTIMIDAASGKRFINESFHYQHFGETVKKARISKVWMISDADSVAKYGIGMAKPAPFSPAPWVRKGYLKSGKTIAELARAIDVPVETLEDTVKRFNGFADIGQDPDFQRGGDYYSTFMGDAMHKPNPALGALRKAPFYAVEIRPSDLSTIAGLDTNASAQVIRKDGTPIAGLYAAGLDSNSLMRGLYPGGGSSIGPAMTFGYIAARNLAARPVLAESSAA